MVSKRTKRIIDSIIKKSVKRYVKRRADARDMTDVYLGYGMDMFDGNMSRARRLLEKEGYPNKARLLTLFQKDIDNAVSRDFVGSGKDRAIGSVTKAIDKLRLFNSSNPNVSEDVRHHVNNATVAARGVLSNLFKLL